MFIIFGAEVGRCVVDHSRGWAVVGRWTQNAPGLRDLWGCWSLLVCLTFRDWKFPMFMLLYHHESLWQALVYNMQCQAEFRSIHLIILSHDCESCLLIYPVLLVFGVYSRANKQPCCLYQSRNRCVEYAGCIRVCSANNYAPYRISSPGSDSTVNWRAVHGSAWQCIHLAFQ